MAQKAARIRTKAIFRKFQCFRTSWWSLEAFLTTSSFWITLGLLLRTYHITWTAFGAIVVRSVLKNTTNAWGIKLSNLPNTIWISSGSLLDELGLHSWPKFVSGSPLAGCSRLTTSPGQPLEQSWSDQCCKTIQMLEVRLHSDWVKIGKLVRFLTKILLVTMTSFTDIA